MGRKKGLGRTSGESGQTRRLCRASWLAALLIVSPAMAEPEADDDASPSVVFGAYSAQVLLSVAQDGELGEARAKGLERMALRPDENVAVILWDEAGSGDRPGAPKHDGNSLITIRYSRPAE